MRRTLGALTVPHYYDFGAEREFVGDDLVRPDSWDALRTRTHGPFAIGTNRGEWERRAAEHPEIEHRARALDAYLEARGVRRLASYGCGGAILEQWLHRLDPERALVLGDYTPETIERLRDFFSAAEVRLHDLLREGPLNADLHLFHRIDTEFTNAQWRELLGRFAAVPVLVLVSEIISVRGALIELRKRFGPGAVSRAGLVRNRPAFELLWKATHDAEHLRFGDLHAWMLRPR